MELAAASASPRVENLIQGERGLVNQFRSKKKHYLIWSLILALLAAVSFLLSSWSQLGCEESTPRKTTHGLTCEYQWNFGDFHCETYCCNPSGATRGDECLVCWGDGYCNLFGCAVPQTKWEYIFGEVWGVSGSVFTYIVLMLILLYARACCKSNTRERKVLTRMACAFVFGVLIFFSGYVMYLFTDCHQTFRGLSDVFLALGFGLMLYCFIFLLRWVTFNTAAGRLDELLQRISQAARRDDGEVLVVELSEERLRSFWQAQLDDETLVTSINVTQTAWSGRCLTWFGLIIIVLMPILFAWVFTARAQFFFGIVWLHLVVMLGYSYSLRSSFLQRWQHRRHVARKLADLQAESVVLFHNVLAEAEGEEARQQDVAFMSAAFFGDVQVFMPHVTSEDRLIWTFFTRTSLVETSPGLWQICFHTSFRRSTQTLLQSTETAVDVPKYVPLELPDVPRVRSWLGRHEVFHFEVE
ncbi:unnamed protein product [Durusdinium trenchii]|uniref:Transmembrane protein n=2 Tax=Durusdinium trenchii TaxID=1381693 RepID=A0ABP0RWK6_9DINO